MFGNVYAERMVLESTYEDIATVYRKEKVKGEDKITSLEDTPVYSGIICAISNVGDNSRQTPAQQRLCYERKLFVEPDKDIKAGDRVVVSRFGRIVGESPITEEYEAVGVPVAYLTHREVFLKAVSLA